MKTPVQQLKCGGKKKKKMADGGVIPYAKLGDVAGDYVNNLITSGIPSEIDNRDNPNPYLKRRDSLTTTGNIAKNTLKGAGVGAAIGSLVPIPGIGTGAGALIGAGVGAVSTGIKNLFTSKAKKAARAADQSNWSNAWTENTVNATLKTGYKEGGKKKENVVVKADVSKVPEKKYVFDPSAVVKDEVNNYYWRPETRKNVGLELLKKGHFGSVQDTLSTLKAWDTMTPEETLKYIDPEKGFDATVNPKNPMTANPGGVRYWVKDTLNTVNTKTIKSSDFSKNYFDAKKNSTMLTTGKGMAKGGEVKGAGGPKTDAITKKVEDGSFIVPAENAERAMELGKNYLNWNGEETANRNYPGTEVKLSNGEVLFTPEEVNVLKYHGLDLNKLAPQAEPGNKMSTGGEKGLPSSISGITKQEDFVSSYLNEYPGASEEDALSAWEGVQQDTAPVTSSPTGSTEQPKSAFQKIMDMAPEIAGAIQLGAASAGLIKAGRMPDINVSESLRQITTESRQEAQYGLEPGTKSAMLNQAEKARRDTTNAIVQRGGSSAEMMANLQGMLSTTIDKKYDIELADSAEKIRKKSIYYGLKSKVADQEFDISKLARQDWLQLQEVNAGLLSAGISNIVGARKLKLEMDTMKNRGGTSINFSAIK